MPKTVLLSGLDPNQLTPFELELLHRSFGTDVIAGRTEIRAGDHGRIRDLEFPFLSRIEGGFRLIMPGGTLAILDDKILIKHPML